VTNANTAVYKRNYLDDLRTLALEGAKDQDTALESVGTLLLMGEPFQGTVDYWSTLPDGVVKRGDEILEGLRETVPGIGGRFDEGCLLDAAGGLSSAVCFYLGARHVANMDNYLDWFYMNLRVIVQGNRRLYKKTMEFLAFSDLVI